jgi:hypothetical protein
MPVSAFRYLTVALLFAIVGLWSASTADAGPPAFFTVNIDRSKVLSSSAHSCDFPIVVHEQGTWEISFHEGPDGTVREIRHAHLMTTYTNQVTGTSVTAKQTRGLNIKYDVEPPVTHPDGSVTYTDEFVGAFQNLVIPGVGSISNDAGRLITTHTFLGNTLIATSATPIAGNFAPLSSKLCDVLA